MHALIADEARSASVRLDAAWEFRRWDDGRVTRVTHKAGKFLPAYKPESGAVNEQSEIWVDHDGRTAVYRQVADQRQDLQGSLRAALAELDRSNDLADLVGASAPAPSGNVPTDAAFLVWSRTTLATRRLTSSVELYDGSGRMVSRFALNLPETSVDQAWQESTCGWELFEEVSPFFAV